MPSAATAKLSIRFLALAAAALATIGVSACDSKSGPSQSGGGKDTRQVTVIGTGQVKGTPDTLTADASIEFTAADVTGAMNQTSDRQQAVITALVNAGVDRKDISTTGVSLQPQFAADGTTIAGYRATNSIEVRIREVGSASRALALIVSSGGDATRIRSVNFSIDDSSQLVRDARTRAYNDAKDRAQQYAQLSGMKLGKVISISEAGANVPPPTPTPMPRATAEAVPLEPGQQTVGFSVTVVWQLD
jgi:uncharacterized protein